jgi:hypothetical protein
MPYNISDLVMKYICYILIPALLSLPIVVSGNQEQEFEYEFIQEDTYYSFRGSFLVNAESECVIDLIYDFDNLSEYTLGAQSVELVQQGDTWYDVVYTYRKFAILKNRSTWRRTLQPDEHKIVFEMLSSENNLKMMPELLSSTGYYHVLKENDRCRVEYFQECRLKPGLFKRAYIAEAKQEAMTFLHAFKPYIERKCE